MNIPGASGSAATMVDGFPMAKNGEGARALSAAITTSTANGAIWGLLVFAFLPYYSIVVMICPNYPVYCVWIRGVLLVS